MEEESRGLGKRVRNTIGGSGSDRNNGNKTDSNVTYWLRERASVRMSLAEYLCQLPVPAL